MPRAPRYPQQNNEQESVEKNRDPIHSGWIRRIARIAGADCKLANARVAQQPQGAWRQHSGTALGVGDNFPVVVGGREQVSVWTILSRQRASGLVKIRRRELDELRQSCLLTHLIDGLAH